MITTNVYTKVFLLIFSTNAGITHLGTMFTIDVDNKQYIITAKHLVKNIKKEDNLITIHQKIRKKIKVVLVGHCKGEKDISVLATNLQLSPNLSLKPSMDKLAYGQDVYFLGFPYLENQDTDKYNRSFPMPFVKKAILSNIHSDGDILLLDGHNNPGFSGGPVVFKPSGSNDFQVAGVILGYRGRYNPVISLDKNKATNSKKMLYHTNTGIIIAYSIKCAVDLIKKNPIGFKLKQTKKKTKPLTSTLTKSVSF